MSDKQYSAGDHIEAKCTKCKAATNHTIVAMVEDKPAKVECNICNGIHKYRNPTVKKAAKKPSATKVAKVNKIETEWEDLLQGADPASGTSYSMQMSVKDGDLIQHPSFGIGRVVSVTKPNKMEVFFRDGIKLLRCSIA